ncbi:MFS general substrate transporter [Byssothecium circinans]|uniref:MFS general substrate transporter n=1 Tax=Byssothecium circinans TaxID=147558 RepID=A0A6A5U3M9_9PLEO|nr:MFS general substrate transporter [Byssothecium circinans]
MVPTVLTRLSHFLGVHSLHTTGLDAYLIISLRCLRMFSAGIPSLILALFFSSLSFPDSRIGLFMTLTLLGDVVLSLVLTLIADKIGRRRILLFGSGMMALSGTAFAMSENFWVLLCAAVFGVISVTGGDCGPFRAVEESVLSGLTDDKTRSDVLAWYVTATTMAGAIGSEVAGRVVSWVEKSSGDVKMAYHILFWGYAGFGVIGFLICLGLSGRCEAAGEKREMRERNRPQGSVDEEEEVVLLEAMTPSTTDGFDHAEEPRRSARVPEKTKQSYFSQISKPTRRIMYPLWTLLAIDSLADGMTPYSLMNYYVDQKFHLSKSTLGDITSASQFLCAVSAIFAGPLSKHIGLINTMVFTHLPSSIASAFIPLPSSVGWTVALLLFRASLNSMDQAPRTAFIAAVVKPEERTGAMGITSMLRTLAMSVGPSITGILAGNDRFWAAFVATGICRITYDLGLWILFVNVKVEGGNGKRAMERRRDEEAADADSIDDAAWDGLLSDSESEVSSEDDSRGRKSTRKDDVYASTHKHTFQHSHNQSTLTNPSSSRNPATKILSKMSTTVSPPPRSSLLGLPLELRQMIYNFVFADDETGDVLIKSRPDSDGIGRTHSDSFVEYHSFTLVNREVHAEVDEWYFTHSRFRFEGQGDAFGLKDFVARVPKKYLQRITRISITYFSLEHMLREQGDARRNKFLTLRRCLNLSLPQMRAFLAAENPAAPPPTDRDAINFFFRDFQLAIDGYNNVRQTVNILNSFPLLKYLDLGMYLSECCVIEDTPNAQGSEQERYYQGHYHQDRVDGRSVEREDVRAKKVVGVEGLSECAVWEMDEIGGRGLPDETDDEDDGEEQESDEDDVASEDDEDEEGG